MSWHADTELLDGYASGRLSHATAWSLEAHVTDCASCRSRLDRLPTGAGAAEGLDDLRLEAVWARVDAGVRAAGRPLGERLLERLGVPETDARLLAATPSLTVPWLAGILLVLAASVAASWLLGTGFGHWPVAFLLVAPLVPVAGVAVAFGPRVDATYELGVVAPMRTSRLLLLRAVVVLACSLLLAALAALALPVLGWWTVAWILPSLTLTTGVLAASTRWHPLGVGVLVAVGWIALVVTLEVRLATPLVAFGSAVQLLMAVALTGSLVVFARRRDRLDPMVGS